MKKPNALPIVLSVILALLLCFLSFAVVTGYIGNKETWRITACITGVIIYSVVTVFLLRKHLAK